MKEIEDWILVYRSGETFKAKIAEDVLKQNGIESHIVSKPDHAIPSIGEAELYAPPERAKEALEVLKKNNILS